MIGTLRSPAEVQTKIAEVREDWIEDGLAADMGVSDHFAGVLHGLQLEDADVEPAYRDCSGRVDAGIGSAQDEGEMNATGWRMGRTDVADPADYNS